MADKDVKIKITTDVEMADVDALESKLNSIESESIAVDVNNISAMQSIEQIGQGFDRLKQGAGEVAEEMGVILDQAGQAEQNQAFLKIGFDKAGSKNAEQDAITAQKKIQDIVASAPGDDVAMNSILSSAVAKDVSLMDKDMQGFANSVSDYFAGAEVNGKLAAEAIQDVRSYINSGNVAELETTGIFNQEQLDQLKDIDSVGERVAKFQEMVNQSAYEGLGTANTLTNKFAEFDGMMAQSQTRLGGLFSEGTKGALDFVLKLNDASGGLLGMGLAAASFATPLFDVVTGLGQIGMNIKGMKDGIGILRELSVVQKLSAAATWLHAQAEAVLTAIMDANPIVIVVLALIALAAAAIWAYQNVDWFRAMVDNAFGSLVQLAQQIISAVMPAIQWLANLFQQFTAQIGLNTNDWTQAILAFILFIPTLPMQVGIALANALAHAFGFQGNFVQSMISAASNAVSGFVSYITQLPDIVMGEFNRVLGLVNDFINSLPSRVWDMGAAIIDALKKSLGIGSPGYMYYMMEGELKRIENLPGDMENDITRNVSTLGSGIVDSFNPNMSTMNGAVAGGSIGGTVININMSDFVVDNDDRVDRLCSEIAKRINWNNETAGRTV